MTKTTLMLGDCLERMKEIPDGSVDAIITDPPYGTIEGVADGESISHGMKGKASWDEVIDHDAMLAECNRILRANGALILFGQEPYTSELITQAHNNIPFSYRLTWIKDHFANALVAKKAPVSYTEDICVFFKRYDTTGIHPLRPYAKEVCDFIGKNKKDIFEEMGHQGLCHFMRHNSTQFSLCTEKTYQELIDLYDIDTMPGFKSYQEIKEINANAKLERCFNLPPGKKYKSNVLEYKKDYTGHHPTQKPVALMEDLITTYTRPGYVVLDFTMGSGSTGVAAVNTGRAFIGIERDEGYFEIATSRIEGAGGEIV